jgi:hypothetical protein
VSRTPRYVVIRCGELTSDGSSRRSLVAKHTRRRVSQDPGGDPPPRDLDRSVRRIGSARARSAWGTAAKLTSTAQRAGVGLLGLAHGLPAWATGGDARGGLRWCHVEARPRLDSDPSSRSAAGPNVTRTTAAASRVTTGLGCGLNVTRVDADCVEVTLGPVRRLAPGPPAAHAPTLTRSPPSLTLALARVCHAGGTRPPLDTTSTATQRPPSFRN